MEAMTVKEYQERTAKRLVDLVNKQAKEGDKAILSWLTKKLIEDNKRMLQKLSQTKSLELQIQG
jgi:nucleoid-associated protein YejK